MAKTSSKELFELIKTLSKTEKANFKLVASTYRSSQNEHYLRLFDAIAASKEYDEKKIMHRLKISPAHFPDLKNYLHKRIMFSLEMFYNNKTVRSEVNSLLDQCRILIKKTLMNQARKKAFKAISLAEQASLLNCLIEARELYLFTFWDPKQEDEMNLVYSDIFNKIQHNIGQLQEYYDIKHLHVEMYLLGMKTGGALSGVDEPTIRQHVKQFEWLNNNKAASSQVAQIVLLRQRHIFHCFLMDKEETSFVISANKLFEKEPLLKTVYYRDYLLNLFNWLYSNLEIISLQEFNNAIDNVHKLIGTMHESEIVEMVSNFYVAKLKWFNIQGRYDEGISYYLSTPILQEEYERFKLNNRLALWLNLSEAYIQVNNVKKALIYINNILNEGYKNLRVDLFCLAHIYSLLVHFCLANYDQLPSMVIKAKRFIVKYGEPNPVYTALLVFFSKQTDRFYVPAERREVLLQLKSTLSSLFTDPHNEQITKKYFDYLAWVDNQIDTKSNIK